MPTYALPGLRHLVAALALGFAGGAIAGPVHSFDPARPPPLQAGPLAVTVPADGVSRLQVEAPHGRTYVLWVSAIGKAPPGGYPVMFLLDGHAAIHELTQSPPSPAVTAPVLLVAVGTPGSAYFDVKARAYDYTPDPGLGHPVMDPRMPDRAAGGAEAFLATLLGPIQQAVAARWPLDPRHRGLWGHSYGGLFTLYTLLRHGRAFQFYAPTSPSLWWYAPFPQQLASAFQPGQPGSDACLLLSQGTAEGRPGAHHGPDPVHAAPAFSAQDLVNQLRPVFGQRLIWRPLQGLSHGATLPASLGPAIRAFSAWSAGAATCGNSILK